METTGQRIRKCRELLGMTQEELAAKLGYKSRSSITKIEINRNGITQSKINAFAEVLGVSPNYLVGWDDDKN